jgi:NAD(P)-dependent dehydrogenase (short-subunit alcohol dehydrogenase family)
MHSKRNGSYFLKHIVKDTPFPWDLKAGARGVQLAEKGIESWENVSGLILRSYKKLPRLAKSRRLGKSISLFQNMKKTALITGGSRGIGFGIAKALANEGYNLAINGVRDEEGAAEALNELRELGAEVLYCQGNIAVDSDREAIVEKAYSVFGQINVLVNNAGIAPRQRLDILETTVENYQEVVKTNMEGPFFLTQAIAKRMAHAKENNHAFDAAIIFVTSISATVASINRGEYCISKAGWR